MANILRYERQSAVPFQAGAAIAIGELVGVNGSGSFVLADNNAATPIRAIGVAVTGGASGANLAMALSGVVEDTSLSLTPGQPVYLSATAGAITQTKPTAAESLIQPIGVAISSTKWAFNIVCPEAALAATGAGTVASVTGLTCAEYGDGIVHKTVLTFADVDFALTDEAGVVAYVGQKVYDFPAGAILMLGAVLDVDLTKSSAGVNDDWDGDVGVGTTTAGNNNALATTEQDIIPTTATPQAVAGATTANAQSTASENKVHDGTSTAKDCFVNFLVDDADHDVTGTACNLIANGTLTLHWINLGDY